ncbi:MAG: helix-turn-helix domain-containing protein [Candidatus Sulfotelmatobacter sp.]
MTEALLKKAEETENPTPSGTLSDSGMLAQPEAAPRATLRSLRDKTEIHAISKALEESGWNRKRAAKLLSISYRGLLYKIRQHNITPSTVSSLTQASRQEM